MKRKILTYPNPTLKKKSNPVENFDMSLHDLLDDMFDTIQDDENAVGLAAIQIGVDLRVIIINIPNEDSNFRKQKENTLEIINPIYLMQTGKIKAPEGCLSVPGFFTDIERFKYISIEYQNRYGQKKIIENDEFLAIALQHEMDHLDGKVFVEKLSILKRKKFEKEWKKRQK